MNIPTRYPYLPPEWAPQSGIQLTWPHAGTDWAPVLADAQRTFLDIARVVSRHERLLVVTPEPEATRRQLREGGVQMGNVTLLRCPTNDTWARDHAPLTLVDEGGQPVLLDFAFNGWGLKYPADRDNLITRRACKAGALSGRYENYLDFVLEGGSVETDGRGTLLTTVSCLLSPNRNPRLSRREIEARLLSALHADRVLWLEHGHVAGDDTDGHIDTLARMAPDDTILYTQCTDPADEHFADLRLMEDELRALRTATGQPYRLLPLPLPRPIVDDLGRRLPATYANFLVINGAVLLPTYRQPLLDLQAADALSRAFPGREVVGVDCTTLIREHGSLHCVSMHYPEGVLLPSLFDILP